LDFPLYEPSTGGVSLPPSPQWTIEFWILMNRDGDVGDIASIVMEDGSKVEYRESAWVITYLLYSTGGVFSTYETAYTTLTEFNYYRTYWKKFIV
jgi:hypothetical protein